MGVYRLAEVRIQDGESIENALRRFKRKVQQEDIIKEVKKHSFYMKPGEEKRIKQALARKRSRKKVRRQPLEDRQATLCSHLLIRESCIGVAQSYCWESPKPAEFGTTGGYWSDIGWKIRVRFTPLTHRIRPKDHMD